jgi:carbamoyl-phosphate synthase large subunit
MLGESFYVPRRMGTDIQMVINTGVGRKSSRDAYHIRRGALTYNILYTTTIAGARALCEAVSALKSEDWQVRPLQEYHRI